MDDNDIHMRLEFAISQLKVLIFDNVEQQKCEWRLDKVKNDELVTPIHYCCCGYWLLYLTTILLYT